jgi:hypothetical protein
MDSKLYSTSLGYNGKNGDNPASTLQPGAVVDRFELLEKLHVGGMAHIWKVQEVNHQGRFAPAAGDEGAAHQGR